MPSNTHLALGLARTLGLVFVAFSFVLMLFFLLIHKARKSARLERARLERARLNRIDGLEAARSRSRRNESVVSAPAPHSHAPVITRPQAALCVTDHRDRRIQFADGGFDNGPL